MTTISPTAHHPFLLANLICLASMVVWAADLILPQMPLAVFVPGALIARGLLTRESR